MKWLALPSIYPINRYIPIYGPSIILKTFRCASWFIWLPTTNYNWLTSISNESWLRSFISCHRMISKIISRKTKNNNYSIETYSEKREQKFCYVFIVPLSPTFEKTKNVDFNLYLIHFDLVTHDPHNNTNSLCSVHEWNQWSYCTWN